MVVGPGLALLVPEEVEGGGEGGLGRESQWNRQRADVRFFICK